MAVLRRTLAVDRGGAVADRVGGPAAPLRDEDVGVPAHARGVVDLGADEGLAAGVMDERIAGDRERVAGAAGAQAVVVVLEVARAEGLVERAEVVEHSAREEKAEADEPARLLDLAAVRRLPGARKRLDLVESRVLRLDELRARDIVRDGP